MALRCSSWSNLTTEILELIFDCTKDPIDILRCGATCKSWRPTALKLYQNFLPLCLIDEDVVFNILTKQTRKIRLPDEVEARRICCSNNGWLLTVDDTDFHSNMQLIDIFTRTRIFLPPIMSLYGCEMIVQRQLELVSWKLFLSKSPLSTDCVVLLLHTIYDIMCYGHCKVSLWKRNDITWTNVGELFIWEYWNFNTSVVLYIYKDKIYVCITDRIDIYIYRDSSLQRMHIVTLPVPKSWENEYNTFLVKSDHEDDVFFAGCRIKGDQPADGKLFFVFEVDILTEELKEVNDLGEYALFLSSNANHLLVKTTGRSKASFKANCIYFFRGRNYEEFGIYDLKTKDIEYVPCQSIIKHANWINREV